MPLRPLNNGRKFEPQSEFSRKFWDSVEKAKNSETHEDQEVFHLTQKEAAKCRFEIIDQNNRLAECTVHQGTFSHGVRLFPPHLWDIRDGIVYHKVNGEWVKWSPIVKENVSRLQDA